MPHGSPVEREKRRRAAAALATLAVHLAILLVLLHSGPYRPASTVEPPALRIFDLPRPPESPPVVIPPPPVPPSPVRRESAVPRPTAGGGSPRPAPAPVAEQAAPAAATPARFDRVDRPAPAADISADLPLRLGTVPSDGRGAGIAGGRGTGGEGQGTGQGRGDGDGPGAGRLRFALAEWIEKPPQYLIDEAFPKQARYAGVSGRVVLLCVVPVPGQPRSCSVAAERPRDRGFGKAALDLYPRFRIKPVMKGEDVLDARVLVPVTFDVNRRMSGF